MASKIEEGSNEEGDELEGGLEDEIMEESEAQRSCGHLTPGSRAEAGRAGGRRNTWQDGRTSLPFPALASPRFLPWLSP